MVRDWFLGLFLCACVGFCTISSATTLRFSEIETRLNSPQKDSVELFLGWMQKQSPGLFEDFTLMRGSQSLQAGSGKYPRAILFGKDAKLLVTFHGDAKLPGYDKLEIARFTDGKYPEFEFREIVFAEGKGKLSAPNPPECLRCHTSVFRPIWERYPIWRGAYGGFDDAIHAPGVEPLVRVADVDFEEMAAEYLDFRQFLEIQPIHARYSFLKPRVGTKMSPYSDQPRRNGYEFRPNLALTKLLTRRHSEHLAGRIARDEACFPRRAPVVVSALWGCTENLSTDGRVEHLESLGVEESDYSLERVPSWNYFQGVTSIDADFADALYEHVREANPHLPTFRLADAESRRLYRKVEYSKEKAVACAEIQKLIPAEVDRDRHCELHLEKTNGVPKVVQMCMACHRGGVERAPVLPLDDPKRMAPEVRAKVAERVAKRMVKGKPRMPPERALSDRERTELLRWIQPRP